MMPTEELKDLSDTKQVILTCHIINWITMKGLEKKKTIGNDSQMLVTHKCVSRKTYIRMENPRSGTILRDIIYYLLQSSSKCVRAL